jgi:hypothetical protein
MRLQSGGNGMSEEAGNVFEELTDYEFAEGCIERGAVEGKYFRALYEILPELSPKEKLQLWAAFEGLLRLELDNQRKIVKALEGVLSELEPVN